MREPRCQGASSARGGALSRVGGVAVEGVPRGAQGGQSGVSSNGAKASKSKQKQANGTIGCTAHAGTNRAKLPTPSSQGYST
jgi:hypothetical protein